MKKIKIGGMAVLLTLCAVYLFKPQELEAKQAEFKYKSITYIEMEVRRFNLCWYPTTECTNEEGSTCTLKGSKVRGLAYCLLPNFI